MTTIFVLKIHITLLKLHTHEHAYKLIAYRYVQKVRCCDLMVDFLDFFVAFVVSVADSYFAHQHTHTTYPCLTISIHIGSNEFSIFFFNHRQLLQQLHFGIYFHLIAWSISIERERARLTLFNLTTTRSENKRKKKYILLFISGDFAFRFHLFEVPFELECM